MNAQPRFPDAGDTRVGPMSDVLEAYRQFHLRKAGWAEVELGPGL